MPLWQLMSKWALQEQSQLHGCATSAVTQGLTLRRALTLVLRFFSLFLFFVFVLFFGGFGWFLFLFFFFFCFVGPHLQHMEVPRLWVYVV